MSCAVRRVVPGLVVVCLLALCAGCAQWPRASAGGDALGARAASPVALSWERFDEEVAAAEAEPESKSFLHRLGLWIPNRIFDVFDIVRARVRLGPGFAFSVRATELADIFAGAYTSVFVGIWGPRGEARIPWPVFVESFAGVGISAAEAATEGGSAPYYGKAEFGAGFHAALIGLDVGVDPLEILDFVAGIVFLDMLDDDY